MRCCIKHLISSSEHSRVHLAPYKTSEAPALHFPNAAERGFVEGVTHLLAYFHIPELSLYLLILRQAYLVPTLTRYLKYQGIGSW